jgi:hypothetical protein
MNINTYIPSIAEMEMMRAASQTNPAAGIVYRQYLENILARVLRQCDMYDAAAKMLADEGATQGAQQLHAIAAQVRECASPLPDTQTPQPKLTQSERRLLNTHKKQGRRR